jgi:hypothetical protein
MTISSFVVHKSNDSKIFGNPGEIPFNFQLRMLNPVPPEDLGKYHISRLTHYDIASTIPCSCMRHVPCIRNVQGDMRPCLLLCMSHLLVMYNRNHTCLVSSHFSF